MFPRLGIRCVGHRQAGNEGSSWATSSKGEAREDGSGGTTQVCVASDELLGERYVVVRGRGA